ncbi:MAG TPA: YhdT family protein [Bacillaceae bacterium]
MREQRGLDWRFKAAHREAWIGIGLAGFHFLWWYAFAYGLGNGPVEEYSYIMGFPAWFFFSCILGFAVMMILTAAAVKLFFQDIPFDEEGAGKR